MNQFGKNFLIWIGIGIAAMALFSMFQGQQSGPSNEVSYSQFLDLVENRQVAEVTMQGNMLSTTAPDGRKVSSRAPNDPELVTTLRERGVNINVKQVDNGTPLLLQIFLQLLPFALIIAVWLFFMRQMQGGGRAMTFGKSRAQLLTENDVKVTFDDVAGVDEAKQELQEIVEFLKDPGKFQRLGGKIPKGALLVGPPGTGKTLLARSVAGGAGVPFFSISGSDFVEMFVGVGASRVRDLFEQGKKNAPCIIFIDEIDAVGRHRGAGLGGGNDEREQTLNQLLVEMDGFEATEGVILIAATNRPDVLDPALLRPGRFDRQVTVPLPDIGGRERILKVHMDRVPLAADVETEVIARGTPGFRGADLANLVNEAALRAARRNKRTVDMADFEDAKDKVMMGSERRSTVMTEAQKKTTAYHEAGHAVATLFLDGPKDPLHKVTIIPRGRALGVTMSLPAEDRFTHDKKYLQNQIAILMGGRIAEELVLDQQTTGASNDIERATDLAHRMVCNWGMSHLGPRLFGENESQVFLGRDIAQRKNMAESTATEVDKAIKGFIDEGYQRCETVIKKHIKLLHAMSEALLEHETLDKNQIDELVAGKPITPRKKSKYEERQAAKKKAAQDAAEGTDKTGPSTAAESGNASDTAKPAAKKSAAKATEKAADKSKGTNK